MRKQLLALAAGVGFFASQAFGAFTSTELIDATRLAVSDFETVNPDHAEHFTGYKAWKSGEDSKVKIYVDHNGHMMEFNYLCQNHDDGIECHAQ